MEPQTTNQPKNYLTKVTPLSKALAAIIFITLPFVGLYIGYAFAPEKVVEVEKIIEIERVNPAPTTVDAVPKSIDDNVNLDIEEKLKEFRDTEVGISFQYPAIWGDVISNDEETGQRYNEIENKYVAFDCPAEYGGNPCNFRTYRFSELGNSASLFLATKTKGSSENSVGRGAFWGDLAGLITKDYLNDCASSTKCESFTNDNGLVFAHYEADPLPAEMGYSPERYMIFNQDAQYFGLVLSPYRLPNGSDSEFKNTVLATFNWVE